MIARRAWIMWGVPILLLAACTPKQPVQSDPWGHAPKEASPAEPSASKADPDTLMYDFLAESAPIEEGSALSEADLPELVTESPTRPAPEGTSTPSGTPASRPAPIEEGPLFWVQVFASGSRQSAEEFALEADARLSERVRILYLEPYYKVLVGGLPTRDEALVLRQNLVEMGYEGAWIFEK